MNGMEQFKRDETPLAVSPYIESQGSEIRGNLQHFACTVGPYYLAIEMYVN